MAAPLLRSRLGRPARSSSTGWPSAASVLVTQMHGVYTQEPNSVFRSQLRHLRTGGPELRPAESGARKVECCPPAAPAVALMLHPVLAEFRALGLLALPIRRHPVLADGHGGDGCGDGRAGLRRRPRRGDARRQLPMSGTVMAITPSVS